MPLLNIKTLDLEPLDPAINAALVALDLQEWIEDAAEVAHRVIASSFRQARVKQVRTFSNSRPPPGPPSPARPR